MNNYTEMTKAELERELNLLQAPASIGAKRGQSRSQAAVDDPQCLLHELQVHQVELEMQNRELREARQELEESRNRYVDLYDSAPNGYLTLDDKGRIREINLTGAQLLGIERSYLTGKPFVAYVARDAVSQFLEHVRRCQQGEEQVMTELTLKGGSARQVQLLSVPMRDEERQVTLFLTALTDVTELRRAEEAKRESEGFSQAVLGSISAQIAVLDKKGKIIAVNDAWTRFTLENGEKKYLRRTGAGASYLNVCRRAKGAGAEGAMEALRGIQAVLDGSQSHFTLEYACHSPTRQRWFTLSVNPMLGSSGGVVVTHHDITARKWAEEAVRESEEKYRTLFESIEQGFCTIEVLFDENERPVDYRFLVVNPAFERQTGIENATGRRMREIAPLHEEHWFEIYGHIALTGEPKRFENSAEQLHRFYEVYAWRISEPAERKVAILFNDITERKRAEEQLIEQAALLDQSHEAIIVRDLDNRIRYWGRGAERLYGWTAEEAVGTPAQELTYRESLPGLAEATRIVIEKGAWNGELRHLTKSGRDLPKIHSDQATPVRGLMDNQRRRYATAAGADEPLCERARRDVSGRRTDD